MTFLGDEINPRQLTSVVVTWVLLLAYIGLLAWLVYRIFA